MDSSLVPDLEQAKRFLNTLDPGANGREVFEDLPDGFSFQTFDDIKGRKAPGLARVINSTLSQSAYILSSLNEKGAGIFVTMNETDGKGRKLANIIRVRALWIEDDEGLGIPTPLEPHLVTETSPGKFHKIFLVDGLSQDQHQKIQDILVSQYGSDPNAKDLARVLRVPGFYHNKGKPFKVRLIHESGAKPFTAEQVLAAFKADPTAVIDRPKPAKVTSTKTSVATLSDDPNEYTPLDAVDLKLPLPDINIGNAAKYLPEAGNQNRSEWLTVGMALHHQFRGSDEGLKLFDEWSQNVREYQGFDDVAATWNSLRGDSGVTITFRSLIMDHWESPNKVESKIPTVDALVTELIPPSFGPWLIDVSHRMQTPLDFPTISAIVICSSIIGAGCGMRPKQKDDWEVIPNLWGACIGRPSVMLKSPSMKEPMQQLERLQAEYGEQFELEKAGAEFDSLANKAMLEDVKGQLTKAAKGAGKDRAVNPDDMQKLKADYLELTQNAEPEATRRLFKTNESSIQSMTVLQTQNTRGMLVFRDELTGLLVKWDREDGQDERAYFLEGWNGNGSYTDCKIGRGVTDAKSICISLLGGIQPDKLKRYLYQAQQGNNDGLMQRLQLAVWPDEPEHWQLIDTLPNKADKQRAYSIVKGLAELDFIQHGATQGEYDDRPHFRFDNEAQTVFNKWLIELQTIKLQKEENPLMVEHFGKFRSLMPSLALIFHCIDIADGKACGHVTAQSAQLAVEWCKYLESHARRIYAMAESPEHEAAVRLAGKIKTGALLSPFNARDVYGKHWHGLMAKQEVEAACNILVDENWLRMIIKAKPVTGRPPLPEYQINPFLCKS